MKKIVFLLTVIMCGLFGHLNGQTTLADYDGIDLNFSTWGGTGSFAKIANPDATGANTSGNVGEFTWGGATFGMESEQLSAPVNFAETPYGIMKIWAAEPILVELQFQKFTDWTQSEVRSYQLTAAQTNKWIELGFDFEGVTKDSLDRVILFLDRAGDFSIDQDKYYFDDIWVSADNLPTAVDKVFKLKIKSYPNPVRDKLTLVLPGEVNIASIMIYDISGKKVYQSNITNKGSVEINFGNYKSGVYIIKAVSEEGYMFTEKIMKK